MAVGNSCGVAVAELSQSNAAGSTRAARIGGASICRVSPTRRACGHLPSGNRPARRGEEAPSSGPRQPLSFGDSNPSGLELD